MMQIFKRVFGRFTIHTRRNYFYLAIGIIANKPILILYTPIVSVLISEIPNVRNLVLQNSTTINLTQRRLHPLAILEPYNLIGSVFIIITVVFKPHTIDIFGHSSYGIDLKSLWFSIENDVRM